MKKLLKFHVSMSPTRRFMLQMGGIAIFLMMWQLLCEIGLINESLVASPIGIIGGFIDLISNPRERLFHHIGYSMLTNLSAFVVAIIAALIVGYVLALFSYIRELFATILSGLRFVPATALIPAFMLLFHVDSIWLKIFWLAFGIWIYLVPSLIDRVQEIQQQKPEYLQTLKTLNANQWMQFTKLFWPGVLPRFSNDIKNLVPISWTYINAIELVANKGGIGSLMIMAQRATRPDKLYAEIIIIMILGIVQTWTIVQIDKKLFKFKHQGLCQINLVF